MYASFNIFKYIYIYIQIGTYNIDCRVENKVQKLKTFLETAQQI